MTAPALEASVAIAAPVEVVWTLVSDVRRMPSWSPQVESTRLRSGFDAVELGTQFTNRNVDGELSWVTHAEIIRFEPQREIAFRVEENRLIWSFALAAEDGGTRLTQRRDAPDGVSDLSLRFVEEYLGGVEAFTESMRSGMQHTLEKLKAEAEA